MMMDKFIDILDTKRIFSKISMLIYKKEFLKKSGRVIAIIQDDYQLFIDILLKLGRFGYKHVNIFIQYDGSINSIDITNNDKLYKEYDDIKINYSDDNLYYTDDMAFMAIADNDDNIIIATQKILLLKLFTTTQLSALDSSLYKSIDKSKIWYNFILKHYSDFLKR